MKTEFAKEPQTEKNLKDIEQEAAPKDAAIVAMVTSEKDKYERNSAEIRAILKKAYRNFMEIYDEPTTRYTKRVKEFWGLSRLHVLSSAAQVYIDPKAVHVLPRQESDMQKATIWNELIPYQLSQINFFQAMNSLTIDLALFGTVVSAQDWDFERETYFEEVEKNFAEKVIDQAVKFTKGDVKPKIKKVKIKNDHPSFKMVPLLNCYIDPSAESIQKALSFITVNFVEESDLPMLKKKYKWTGNVEGVKGTKLLTGTEKDNRMLLEYAQHGVTQRELQVPIVEVLERWGKVKLSWVTDKDEDKDTWVEGKITLLKSRTEDDNKFETRLMDVAINKFKHGKRPFEECWYIKMPGSWYGLGVGQMLISPNAYLNRILNQRVDNNEILQHKMFKAKRGAGLDNKSIAAAPGKVVTVQNMDDFAVLETGSADLSSYKDEEVVINWAERLTHVKDPSSQKRSATEAQLDDQASGEFFAIVRRNINDYLKRVVTQIMQLDMQFIDQEVFVRITGEPADFQQLDSLIGVPEEIRAQLGNYRFIKVEDIKEIIGEFDVEVDIDNSIPRSIAFTAQSLEKMLTLSMQDPNSGLNRGELYKEWAQKLGFKGMRFFTNTTQQMTMPMPGQQPIAPNGMPQPMAQAPMPGVVANSGGIATNLQGRSNI